jgi:hypothetical protein
MLHQFLLPQPLSIFYKYLSKWRKNEEMEEQIYHYMLLILAVFNPKCSSLVPMVISGNTARKNIFQLFQSDQSTGTTVIYNWPASSVDFRHKHSNCITWTRFPFNTSGISSIFTINAHMTELDALIVKIYKGIFILQKLDWTWL